MSNNHGDNGIFFSQALKKQKITFSGSCAYHQNRVSERSIQTVVGWTRKLQLLISKYGHLPQNMQLFFGISFQINRLIYHLWSWSLDLAFQIIHSFKVFMRRDVLLFCWTQNYKMERNFQSCLPDLVYRLFYSHSLTVSLFLNLQTAFVSPQYHCMMIGLALCQTLYHPLSPQLCGTILSHLAMNM